MNTIFTDGSIFANAIKNSHSKIEKGYKEIAMEIMEVINKCSHMLAENYREPKIQGKHDPVLVCRAKKVVCDKVLNSIYDHNLIKAILNAFEEMRLPPVGYDGRNNYFHHIGLKKNLRFFDLEVKSAGRTGFIRLGVPSYGCEWDDLEVLGSAALRSGDYDINAYLTKEYMEYKR